MKYLIASMLAFALFVFIGCGKKVDKMPESKIAITNRMVVIDGPTRVGKWHGYILKDTLTGKQYFVVGNYDSVSVTPLEVKVEE